MTEVLATIVIPDNVTEESFWSAYDAFCSIYSVMPGPRKLRRAGRILRKIAGEPSVTSRQTRYGGTFTVDDDAYKVQLCKLADAIGLLAQARALHRPQPFIGVDGELSVLQEVLPRFSDRNFVYAGEPLGLTVVR